MVNMGIMYSVIEELAKIGVPAVFKGAMVLDYILINSGYSGTRRTTRDIDMDWVDGHMSDSDIKKVIKCAVGNIGTGNMDVIQTRKSSSKRSAGFDVKVGGGLIFSVDVGIRVNPFYCEYYTSNGVPFMGASIDKMLADKVSVLSTRIIFRRAKDLYDLYVMSSIGGYELGNVMGILDYNGRVLGEFNEFKSMKKELEHAYNMLGGIGNKPSFTAVYARVIDFCLPFIVGGECLKCNALWDSERGMWFRCV